MSDEENLTPDLDAADLLNLYRINEAVLSQTPTSGAEGGEAPVAQAGASTAGYTYYSDMFLTKYLPAMGVFAYGSFWESSILNDFVKSDQHLLKISVQLNFSPLYYDVQTAVANIDAIVGKAAENASAGEFYVGPSTGIQEKPEVAQQKRAAGLFRQPLDAATDVNVNGAPDLIILNVGTDYYRSLDISGATATQTRPGGLPGGYVKLWQTAGAAYFVSVKSQLYGALSGAAA